MMAAPMPGRIPTPMAGGFVRPHVGVNVYPSVSSPRPHPDGPNLYQYVRSNPVNRLDPDGMKSIELKTITMKRKHIKWSVVAGKEEGDGYGHWWAELDGTESYGWWPKNPVPGLWETLVGVEGELNGQTSFGGTPTRDPHHGDKAEDTFHPWRAGDGWFGGRKLKYGAKKGTSCSCVSEGEIKDCIKAFVADFAASNTSWRYPFSPNCHSFQEDMMKACCMKKK
jgi:hypothetical protein